ncbi:MULTISPECIES: metallophosphoesterase family protein [Sphingomonas]|uniref:metallophosphoesterase family protein n=1 Tax=Sphingomonas TaxID=13687 RepID=UPI000F7E606E|nr:metallophosphoesterase [Sphingomonas sp. ABOLF]RSV17863.1 metallophosphoesterase [Sphingomonas sp. ABOLF]GLK20633.1 metallophosphoesterase [Microbacterium terregens]
MSEKPERIVLAATGDLHVNDADANRYRDLFAEISEKADVLALTGDLTNFGRTREAENLAEDLRYCTIPVVAVLGNHDYECGQPEEVVRILQGAGVTVLDEQAVEIAGVGFAGVKGFVGGFDRAELGAFGEKAIKDIVDESLAEARKLENALRTLRTDRAVALLHYSPVAATVEGEPKEIWPFLGSSRLADAVDRFDNVRLVLHGHAHRGSYEGRTRRGIPVHNVAQFVLTEQFGKPYMLYEV